AGRGELARLMAFRKLLDRGGRWKDKSVQAAWQKVSHLPEAKYWALKSLRADPMSFRDVTLHAARLELEQALDSLEVSR
ncbi:MAG: hypothetical protein HY075_00565, partial [Deltaproteobacteria bacterium]|nr:hypothetical protein [Deltaproteobacteria bacterium]